MATPIYVCGLRAENFLRLELVELRFAGPGLELVTGNNGEGKSSLLRAIGAALAGKSELPEQPVRKGKERALIDVDLGDKVVKLRVKPDRSTTLTVEAKDGGATYRSPQKLLDDLFGQLAFDPVAFAEMEPRAQAEQLKRLVGLDFGGLDAEHRRLYDERTGVNRDLRNLEGQLSGMATLAAPADVGAERSAREVIERLKAAQVAKGLNDAARAGVQRATREVQRARDGIPEIDRQIAALEQQLVERRSARDRAVAQVERLAHEAQVAIDGAAALVDPDLDAIAAEQDALEEHNRAVRERQALVARAAAAEKARAAKLDEIRQRNMESDRLTARLDAISADKAARLAAAQFPIPGLSVEGDTVTLDGLPLSQASSSQQLRACLAIAAALNPKLRLLLVRQGNDLDAVRLRQVADWAQENSYQVLMERVASGAPVGIVIEAGRVVADHRTSTATAQMPLVDDFA